MPKIRQADIYPNAISATKASSYAITSSVFTAQGNLTKTAYAIGTVGGMASSDPISIKEYDGFGANFGWADEQDWTVYNQSFTTVIPVTTSGSVVTSLTIANASISIGDLVGIYGGGAWSLSGSLNTARNQMASAGSQNAALVAGDLSVATTELFNGSAWSFSAPLSVAKYYTACGGTQNAAFAAGGTTLSAPLNDTVLFNGSTWRNSGTMNTARLRLAGFGSANAAVAAGGLTTGNSNVTEIFNGALWFTSGALSGAARVDLLGCGTQTAGLVTGGQTTVALNIVELFNGSSWSFAPLLQNPRFNHSCFGTQNAAVVAAGTSTLALATTEIFNGSAWQAVAVMSQTKSRPGTAGSQNQGLAAGGSIGGASALTELYNQNIYRKITTMDAYKNAVNVGIAYNVTSLTLSVKFNGYVDGVNVTSSNVVVTTAAQWVDGWVVLPRYSQNASTTNNPSSIIVKPTIEADDLLIARAISRTQMQVFFGNIFGFDRIGRW